MRLGENGPSRRSPSVVAQGAVTVPGSARLVHLEEDLGVLAVRLSAADRAELDRVRRPARPSATARPLPEGSSRRPGAATTMRNSIRGTSTRTFLAIPAAVLVEQAVRRRPLRPRWIPVMAWGYLQYRLSGQYRITRAGGPSGMSQGQPDRLVTTGVYARTRNPMYMGHLVFLTGLTLATRSPLSLAVTAGLVHWFDERARKDHRRLIDIFGEPYEEYAARVPRWLPGLPTERP